MIIVITCLHGSFGDYQRCTLFITVLDNSIGNIIPVPAFGFSLLLFGRYLQFVRCCTRYFLGVISRTTAYYTISSVTNGEQILLMTLE